jgi:hypothetical protein
VKLTTHIHLVPGLRMMELYIQSSVYLHGILLNYINKCKDNFAFTIPKYIVSTGCGCYVTFSRPKDMGLIANRQVKPLRKATCYISLIRLSLLKERKWSSEATMLSVWVCVSPVSTFELLARVSRNFV